MTCGVVDRTQPVMRFFYAVLSISVGFSSCVVGQVQCLVRPIRSNFNIFQDIKPCLCLYQARIETSIVYSLVSTACSPPVHPKPPTDRSKNDFHTLFYQYAVVMRHFLISVNFTCISIMDHHFSWKQSFQCVHRTRST